MIYIKKIAWQIFGARLFRYIETGCKWSNLFRTNVTQNLLKHARWSFLQK